MRAGDEDNSKTSFFKSLRLGRSIADELVPCLKAITLSQEVSLSLCCKKLFLTVDEFEAMRLADLEGLYQERRRKG